jgi:hypothetical protein
MRKLPVLATVGRALKNSGIELYRSLGYSLITSIIWFFAFCPILLLLLTIPTMLTMELQKGRQLMDVGVALCGALLIVVVNGLVTGPVTTALFGLLQVRKEGYPNLKSFLQCLFRFYWVSCRVHFLFSLTVGVLFFNVLMIGIDQGLLIKFAGIFSIYGLLFLLLMSVFLQPLIYYRNRFGEVVKKSFLLVMDNLLLCLVLSLVLTGFFLLNVVLVFPVLLIFGAFYIYLLDSGFELIAAKYEPVAEQGAKEE